MYLGSNMSMNEGSISSKGTKAGVDLKEIAERLVSNDELMILLAKRLGTA
jgi:hypothetical protein